MSLCLKFLRAAVVVCAGVLLLGVPAGRADTGFEPPEVKTAKAMIALTNSLDQAGVNPGKFFEDYGGFPPAKAGIDQHTWLSMPDLVKVQVMYKYAAANSPPSAEWMMYTLIRAAQDGGHIPPDDVPEALKPYLNAPPELPRGFDPRRPESLYKLPEVRKREDLKVEEREFVRTLATRNKLWVNGGPLNGLKREFNMKLPEAVDLLISARTHPPNTPNTLPKDPEERAKVIADARKRLDQAVLREREPRGTSAPQPKLPGALDKLKLIKAWEDNTTKELPNLEDRKYENIKKKPGFPGGILFGAEVGADPKLGKPKAMKYMAGEPPAEGSVEFLFPDDTVLTLRGVNAEDAAVAAELIFGKKAVAAGEGIPIIDISGDVPYYQFGDNRLVVGKRGRVLLNPTLLDTGLGWAAVYIDSLPESRTWLLTQVKDDPVLKNIPDEDERREMERYRRQVIDWVFDPWRNARREDSVEAARITLYRIHDVPMRVAAKDGALVVTRNSKDEDLVDSLLEMQILIQPVDADRKPMGEPTSLDRYTTESARLMPALTTFSPEFRRLSNFARLLSVFRWARDSGVKQLDGAPDQPKGPPTPAAIATTATEILPIEPFDSAEVAKEDIKKAVERRAKLRKDPGVVAYEAARAKLTATLDEADLAERPGPLLKRAEIQAKEVDRLLLGTAVRYLRELVDLEFDYKVSAILDRRLKKGDSDYDGAIADVKKTIGELSGPRLSTLLEKRRLVRLSALQLKQLEDLRDTKQKKERKNHPEP